MTDNKRPFVDAHIHLWDSITNPWYAFPVPGSDWGLGLRDHFPARFLSADYRQAVASMDVRKCVHVTAVTDSKDAAAESRWLEDIAQAEPLIRATVGTVDLAAPGNEIEKALDREMASPRFRGIRMLGGMDYDDRLCQGLLQTLARRNLVYDAVTHFDKGIAAAATALRRHEDLTVVLEHCGWPSAHGSDQFIRWRQELGEFAALPNTYCKLSGVGMWTHQSESRVLGTYYQACIDLFGPERCMFATNFPVDLSYGHADAVFEAFEAVAQKFSAREQTALFAGVAERVYRI